MLQDLAIDFKWFQSDSSNSLKCLEWMTYVN